MELLDFTRGFFLIYKISEKLKILKVIMSKER